MSVRLRGLSVVHWLIIINVAIFMIESLAPPSMWMAVSLGDQVIEGVDLSQVDAVFPTPPSDPPSTIKSLQFAMPIIDAGTGQVIGRRMFQWMAPLHAIGHFSTARAFFGLEVWRFISFQFLHANMGHILFNMIGLWFFGPIVERALRTPRRFLAFYLICGIAGALLYLALNLLGTATGVGVRALLFNDIHTPLIGASAGVFGVLMACAFVAGDAVMLLMLIIPMRVRTGAYLMFGLALYNVLTGGANAGGDAAHIGGALAGFYFIRHPQKLHEFFDVLKRSAPGMSSGKTQRLGSKKSAGGVSDSKIDAILRKVSEKGLHSLSDSEKKTLTRASQDRRGGR